MIRGEVPAMTERGPEEKEVFAFILEKVESVPHLEALLLLWNTRPKAWSEADLARRLYVDGDAARRLLQDLVREGLISSTPDGVETYSYRSESQAEDSMIEAVDRTYRRQIVRVSTMIHSKGSTAVRDFARAFRFTKEKG